MACRSLDDDAAAAMVERLAGVQAALALVDHPARRAEWPAVLTVIAERGDVHGLVQGRATRLLHDGGTWNRALVGARLSRALSVGTTPAVGAAFVEGFLAGSGTVLGARRRAARRDRRLGVVARTRRVHRHRTAAAAHVRRVRAGRASPARPADRPSRPRRRGRASAATSTASAPPQHSPPSGCCWACPSR